jgi:3-oxoacyl-[acyl-carrier protein] reductase
MSDFLLDLNPSARKVIKSLGLPIPMPEKLRRARGPHTERPLDHQTIVVGGVGTLAGAIAETLTAAGASPMVIGDDALVTAFAEPGEAFGRPSAVLEIGDLPAELVIDGLVFDASGLAEPAQLHALYDFFHPLVGKLVRSGRVVVLGRPVEGANSPEAAAAQAALEGFVRSLAKELGKRGATAQLLVVEDGAEARVEGVMRFVLSSRSAFMTGQPIRVSARAKAPAKAPWVHSLEGKIALVTGAARGIGEATARLLAAEGAHVVCLDRPADDGPCSQVARAIGGSVLMADITDGDAPQRIADELRARFGGIDIVVNNAGITRDKTLAKMTAEAWDQTMAVNLDAVARLSRALGNGVLRDGGRIVCLSSVAGIAGNVGQTNYAASKAGIIGFVEALAPTLAARGITVNAVAPGFIETRLTAAIPTVIREVGRRLSALGQGGLPEDIGQVVTFLCTPGASGVTGNLLRVCGGALIGK